MSDAPSLDALAAAAAEHLAAFDAPGANCTGITATWCPACGDCTCGPLHKSAHLDAAERSFCDDGCPLHSKTSVHADDGTVAAEALAERAPDLARGLVAAVAALRAEREARAAAERERATYHADAHRLAAANGRLVDEADAARRGRRAAEAQRDALVAAVRAYLDAADERECAAGVALVLARAETVDTRKRLDALLSGAPADVVRAGVVRDLLARFVDGDIQCCDFIAQLAALAAAEGR